MPKLLGKKLVNTIFAAVVAIYPLLSNASPDSFRLPQIKNLTGISSNNQTNIDKIKNTTIQKTLSWLLEGKVDSSMLANDFLFSSPYYKNENKAAFIEKFQKSSIYKDTVLAKIKLFDPVIIVKDFDNNYFAIIMQYHTYSGHQVYETVLGKLNKEGLLLELRSIYDLEETKKALEIA